MHEFFVSVEDLYQIHSHGQVVIIDCRFTLDDPSWGNNAWTKGHLPGAFYAHLENDLSGTAGVGLGRHPLPDVAALSRKLCDWGVDRETQVVVYDDTSGAMAARLWWLLRHMGLKKVAVLDGGIQAWVYAGLPLESQAPGTASGTFDGVFGAMPVVDTACLSGKGRDQLLLIDARAGDRFRGEAEPIDRIAGHVPNAVNRPYYVNLDASGCIRNTADLRHGWRWLVGDWEPSSVVHMCGSGVTACLSLLAMEHAGLHGSVLYPESWSGWIHDTGRPVVTLARQA